MSNPADIVTLHVKTELQYDVDSQQSSFPFGYISQLAVTVTKDQLLNVYYISNSKVYNAEQDPSISTGGATNWSFHDMNFPSENDQPFIIGVLSIPDSDNDLVMVVTKAGYPYIITLGVRYPTWTKLRPVQTSPGVYLPIVACAPFVTSANVVLLSASVKSEGSVSIWFLDPSSSVNGWTKDEALAEKYNPEYIINYSVSASLGKDINSTTWGYATVDLHQGLALATGGGDRLEFTLIDPGSFLLVTLADLPPDFAYSLPLVFAIDNKFGANYFQVGIDGKFTPVPLFPGIKVQTLCAFVRSDVGSTTHELVELFALGVDGNIYHLESAYDDILKVNSFVQLDTGNWAVKQWRSVAPGSLSTGIYSIALPSSINGSLLPLVTWSSSANSLTVVSQDPETSNFIRTKIVPPPSFTSTPITQTTVYYVEVLVRDGNRVPCAGRAVMVSSTQSCTINANGRMISVGPNHTATVLTNGIGNACFTLPVNGGLGVPTFTIWAAGMAADAVIDVQPNGAIQGTLSALDNPTLRSAINQETGKTVFDPKLSDEDVTYVVNSVKQVIAAVDPGFAARNIPLSAIDPLTPHRLNLHSRTKGSVAWTRARNARPLGRVRGKAPYGVHITLRPDRKVIQTSLTDGDRIRKEMMVGLDLFDISWGDLWEGVKQGFNTVTHVFLDPIVDGLKATINFITKTTKYAWNGVVDFVQNGYNVIMEVFDSVGATFSDTFGWLAWLVDWDDIRKTAQKFGATVNGFQAWGTDLLSREIPAITQNNFSQLKAWITANFDAVKQALGTQGPGTYDKDYPPTTGALTDANASLLDDLPSTATWLMNKIFNAGGGDSSALNFGSATDMLDSLWAKFQDNMSTVGINTDLQNAYEAIGNTLMTFKDRDVFDATSWASLLDVAKNFILIMCDVVELAVLTLADVFQQVLNFFFALINSTIDIPVVSYVFKSLTGVELTLLNTSCFIIAAPYNIIYKIVSGEAPFAETTPQKLGADESAVPDPVNLSRGVASIVSGIWVALSDAGDIDSFSWSNRTVLGLNLTLSIVPIGLGGYPAIANPLEGSTTFWAASSLPAFVNVAFAVFTRGRIGPAGHPIGLVSLGLVGTFQLGAAFWSTINVKTWNPKTKAMTAAVWFAPWTNLTRWMKKIDDPYVKAAQFVINLVCGVGTGSALIAVGLSPTGLVAASGQPTSIMGSPLTLKYQDEYKSNPKYLEYLEAISNKKSLLRVIPDK